MRAQTNPLIADAASDTLQNATEALGALMVLLADQHSGICRLLGPIVHALEHVSGPD